MKKIICALLCLFCLSLAIACNNSNNPSGDNNDKHEYVITMDTKDIELKVNDTFQLDARVNEEVTLFYESSSNKTVRVSQEGLITAVAEGEATIKVSVYDDENVYKEVKVIVKKQLTSLVLSGGTEVYIGKEITLTANYDKTVAVNLEWKSLDESIATVNNGVVKGVKEGKVVIELTEKTSGLKATKEITVLKILDNNDIANEVLEWAVNEVGNRGANEVVLPTKYDKYPQATIKWDSSDTVLFDPETGLLDINDYDQVVDVTCTVTYNDAVVSKTYEYTIYSYVLYNMSTKFQSQFKNNTIFKDMNVVTSYPNYGGVTITWKSLNPAIFENTGKYNMPFNDEEVVIQYTIKTTNPQLTGDFEIVLKANGMNMGEKAEFIGTWLKENVGDNGVLSKDTVLPTYIEDFNASLSWHSANGGELDLSILAGNPILGSGGINVTVKVSINGESASTKLYFLTKSAEYNTVWDQIQLFFDTITTTNAEQFKYTLVTWAGNSYGYIPFITNDRIEIREDILPYTYGNQRTGIKKTSTEYIVCHDTGNASNGANAEMHRRYITNLNNNPDSTSISWHFTIDDVECIQHLPLDEVAWHAGDGHRVFGQTYHNETYNADSHGGGNMNGIGIESCIHNGTDYTHTMLRYAKLVAGLCVDFHLGTDRVQQHNYFSGKDCPWVMRNNNRWDEFMFLVKLEYFAMTALKDVKLEWTSLTDLMNEEGRLSTTVEVGTKLSYQLKATYNGETRTYLGEGKVVKR